MSKAVGGRENEPGGHRTIALHFGGLTGNDGSLCFSVCCGNRHGCRFLGLCVGPRVARTSGRGGTLIVRATRHLGRHGVQRIIGKRAFASPSSRLGRIRGIRRCADSIVIHDHGVHGKSHSLFLSVCCNGKRHTCRSINLCLHGSSDRRGRGRV